MQNPDRVQEQSQDNNMVERAHHVVTQERKGAAEREFTKFRALNEVLVLAEQSLVTHRTQIVTGQQPPTVYVVEGIDAAIEELRRLQKQTQEFALKNEGALTALTALEETFQQVAAAAVPAPAKARGPKAVPVAAPEPTESEGDSMDLLNALEEDDSAKEPIEEPRQRASRRPK
jgi:hypothetical protein